MFWNTTFLKSLSSYFKIVIQQVLRWAGLVNSEQNLEIMNNHFHWIIVKQSGQLFLSFSPYWKNIKSIIYVDKKQKESQHPSQYRKF